MSQEESSERYPPIKPSEPNEEQKESHHSMSQSAEKLFGDTFKYKKDDGSFIGPMAPLLYTPKLGTSFFSLVDALGKIPNLSPAAKETVILATGSHYQAPYEIYAHERIALKATNLTKDQIYQIKNGQKPEDLESGASIAFDATMEW